MKPRTILHLVLALLLALGACGSTRLGAFQPPSSQRGFIVIASRAGNSSGGAAQLRKLFLKQTTTWSGGRAAKPYDRKPDHPAHRAFVTNVLGMTESQLATHWLRVKQTTGATPPRAVRSDRALIKLVAKHPSSFGFLSAEQAESLPTTVRVILKY